MPRRTPAQIAELTERLRQLILANTAMKECQAILGASQSYLANIAHYTLGVTNMPVFDGERKLLLGMRERARLANAAVREAAEKVAAATAKGRKRA